MHTFTTLETTSLKVVNIKSYFKLAVAKVVKVCIINDRMFTNPKATVFIYYA